MPSLTNEERSARQRDFYLKLVPQGGQILAHVLGGFTAPGQESQEEELKEVLKLWITSQHNGTYETLADASWWMTQFQDPNRRMSRADQQARSDELISYGIAVIGQLLDQGIIAWKKDVPLPEFRTSTHGLNDSVDQAILDRLEASLKDDDDDE